MSEPVIELLEQSWASIAALLGDLDDADWERPTELPGWTVRDVVSHMIGTERMLLGDSAPDAPSTVGDHVRNPIGEFNEAWVAARRSTPGPRVREEFEQVTSRRLEELRAMPSDGWDEIGFTPEGQGPYRRFMEIRVFDCWEHEQDIRRALDRPGHLQGPVADHSLGEVTGKLGYIVAKKAAAPDGATVVFDIDGPTAMVLPVLVEGRARLLEAAPADPTVVIHLDTEAYNALACGRWQAEGVLASDRARIDGDIELGRRVLDNMTFVI